MKNDNIRVFAFKNQELVRSLMLTQNQIDIIKFIAKQGGGVFSTLVSKKANISIQSASTILATLHRKGYLVRKEQVHPTGGSQYLYDARLEFVAF